MLLLSLLSIKNPVDLRSNSVFINPQIEKLLTASPQTTHTAMSSAISQLIDGRPVDVQPVFDSQPPVIKPISPNVSRAQIEVESRGTPHHGLGYTNKSGAVGPAQIIPKYFPQYDADRLKNDWNYAINSHDEIMNNLIKKHQGSLESALAEYHGGPNMKHWGQKTFDYITKVEQMAQEGQSNNENQINGH